MSETDQYRRSGILNKIMEITIIRQRCLLFFAILGGGSVFQYLFGLILTEFFGYAYPYNSPFFLHADRFMDFFNNPYYAISGNELESHSPFVFLFCKALGQIIDYSSGRGHAKFTNSGMAVFWSSVGLFSIFLGSLSQRILKLVSFPNMSFSKRIFYFSGIMFLMVTSYPVLFAIERGNHVMFTFMLLYLAIFHIGYPFFCSIFLAAAIASKFYLGLLLFAFLRKNNCKSFIYTSVIIALVNIAAAIILSNESHSFTNVLSSVTRQGNYDIWPLAQKMGWTCHLLNLLYPLTGIVYLASGKLLAQAFIPTIEGIYFVAVFVPGVLGGTYLILKKVNDLIGQLFCLTTLCLMLTPWTGNYTLIYLLLFLPYLFSLPVSKDIDATIILLAIAMMPKYYITLFVQGDLRVTLQSILTPIALLGVVVAFLKAQASLLAKSN